jgi:carbon-monoxide dehydrogenase medium subunit
MKDFAFHRPTSVADAIEALKSAREGKFLAGGQSLLPVMKLQLAGPTDLVSVAGLAELKGIQSDGDHLVIGAATTHDEVSRSAAVRAAIPALAKLAGDIGDPQVRNRGTIGGSVAHNDPAADYPAALVALGATVVTDRREIPADEFFGEMFATPLEDDELVTAVRFPIPDKAAYSKFSSPASRYALVGVMVASGPAGVRVSVTGAGPGVFRVSAMEQALAADFSPGALEGITVEADGLVSDLEAGADYRAHLVTVMAKRAVAACG